MTMTGFSDILVRKGIRKGEEIGKEENTVKIIWNMHRMDFADEIISKAVEEPVDYVREVLKKAPPL